MIVMRIAITPSLNASRRVVLIGSLRVRIRAYHDDHDAFVRESFDQEVRGQPSALLAGDRRVPELTVAKFRRDPL
jgi:hypothetical protein